MSERDTTAPDLVIGPVRRLPDGRFACDAARLRGARRRWSVAVWPLDPAPGDPIAWSGRAQAAAVRRRRIEEAAATGAVIALARSSADVAALDGRPASAYGPAGDAEDPFLVVVGEERCRIDEGRAAERRISARSLERIKSLHRERLAIVRTMREERDPASLRALATEHERIEFDLQEAWGFPRDRRFHRWWTVPGCRCPRPDNEDAWGGDQRYVRPNCPIHGDPPDH